jgi:CO dehydrogenase nickel-insertion accessory protein CooC1
VPGTLGVTDLTVDAARVLVQLAAGVNHFGPRAVDVAVKMILRVVDVADEALVLDLRYINSLLHLTRPDSGYV